MFVGKYKRKYLNEKGFQLCLEKSSIVFTTSMAAMTTDKG